ncbi:MAG: winged helix-turn-helix transcriptional regulator [Oscillospiraceae bacterium]|jgi:predicted transcriptional regulator|nr:winged helix-turn-helix transcriptional regulator [Oscillospiraceae bacterium]
MIHVHDLESGLPIFKCLSSQLRIDIINMLQENGALSMSDIADRLNITSGALTPHIKQLTDCGFISVTLSTGKRGLQRICSVNELHILVDPVRSGCNPNVYESEISVGQYIGYEVFPTCGLATPEHIIGMEDDPRFFASPERINAGIVWIGQGYFEYMLPNFLQPGQQLIEMQISMELSSEAPGFSEDWPSDLCFYLNNHELCTWTSPGDFGKMRGIYTPSWWDRNWNQHGLFKLLSIDNDGTYIDGLKRSDVSLGDLNITNGSSLILKISAPKDAANVGGLTIYGRSFGNYDQGIRIRMHYRNAKSA